MAFYNALRLTRKLGRSTTLRFSTSLHDIHDGPLALFDGGDVTPGLVINLRYVDVCRNQCVRPLRNRALNDLHSRRSVVRKPC